MPVENHESRMKSFKNRGKDQDEMRRRRTEVSVELRKAKKDDQLAKRRNMTSDDEATSPIKSTARQLSIEEIVDKLESQDHQKQFEAVQSARKMLSKERNPPIESVINAGILPHFIRLLNDTEEEMQFEAAWVLTNVASGNSEQTMAVVRAGAIEPFVKLLTSTNTNVCEQAVWALGNIAGDGSEMRDRVLKAGVLRPLMMLIRPDTPVSFLRNVAWTLSNLCRNKNPHPPEEAVKQMLPALLHLLQHHDTEVLSDSCWAISYLTDGSNDKIQTVIETGIVSRLVELLKHNEVSIITPALRACGNIVTGDDAQTQVIIDSGALKIFSALLRHTKPNIQKESAWAISNVTAGNVNQIQAVIDAGLIPQLIEVLNKGDFKTQKEAAWAITNMTSGGSNQQILYAVKLNCVPSLCAILKTKEPKMILVILEALYNILQLASKENCLEIVTLQIEECDGLDLIEKLQEHENGQVYNMALQIIETFFGEDAEIQEEDLIPDSKENQFVFAMEQQPTSGFKF